ncbi:hypothetical protein K432DRAFT_377708 [Lepidopterella palustris CBS 459.81]|uniref:Uncharacterized protein n=1 Tax=Lepidopterella palustris CBS 459.81 TaxID=1314670 RepID=A0A8E2JK41_9PEZI|nr:hypothetical protein K432DRAFT_377708 [Lepidopterella palustris CBS 459.81]
MYPLVEEIFIPEADKLFPFSQAFADLHQEFVNHGAFSEYPHIQPPDLDNAIHPLFEYKRWVGGKTQHTEILYDRISPALRLATLFITKDLFLGWWSHLHWGHRKTDKRTGKKYITDTDIEHTEKGRRKVKERFLKMAKSVTLHFFPVGWHPDHWGETHCDRQYIPYKLHYHYWPPVDRSQPCPVIGISDQYQNFFLHDYDTATLGARVRTLFCLAETLVHEVAHAFYMHTHPWHQDQRDEPYHTLENTLDISMPELGASWQNWAVGCQVRPTYNLTGGTSALLRQYTIYFRPGQHTLPMPYGCPSFPGVHITPHFYAGLEHLWTRASDGEPDGTRVCFQVMPMKWVSGWFNKSEWRKLDAKTDEKDRFRQPGQTLLIFFETVNDGQIRCFYGKTLR